MSLKRNPRIISFYVIILESKILMTMKVQLIMVIVRNCRNWILTFDSVVGDVAKDTFVYVTICGTIFTIALRYYFQFLASLCVMYVSVCLALKDISD